MTSLVSGFRVSELSSRATFGARMFLTDGRVDTLQGMLEAGLTGRMASKWAGILARDNRMAAPPVLDPWLFPPHYEDEYGSDEAIDTVRAAAEPAVDLAIRWRVLGDPEDAAAVVRILTPWTELVTINTSNNEILNWANKFPMFIQAADLIKGSAANTVAFETKMKSIVRRMADLLPGYYKLDDNRGAWGVFGELASAAYLGERGRFDRAIWRWRQILNESLVNNVPVHEVYREGSSQGNGSTGLHYSNFLLDALVQGAEVARFNGEWLYDHVTPDGSTLKGLWENVTYWTAHPAQFPYNTSGTPSTTNRIRSYTDILHELWPNDSSTLLKATYDTTQDYYGFRRGVLAYQGRPLFN